MMFRAIAGGGWFLPSLAITVAGSACDGKSTAGRSPRTSASAGSGFAGGGPAASGGAGGQGVAGSQAEAGTGTPGAGTASGTPAGAGHGGNAGGPPITGGGAGDGGESDAAGAGGDIARPCNVTTLWNAIVSASVGRGECVVEDPPPTGDEVNRFNGAVVFDDEGRLIDNTGLTGSEKQSWLDQFAGERWVCLAGNTIGYRCEGIR